MRILHTADWHLNDRLGRIDRTSDLRKAVERIADLCSKEKVDVLLIAGDLFSELARPDALRESISHWQAVFAPFLEGGGTILALTGNHDNETFCQTLCHAMTLAAPTVGKIGEVVPPGRLHLAAEPTFIKLIDRQKVFPVQFVLMPYPTPTRYLKGLSGQKYSSLEEKQALLTRAFEQTLNEIRAHPQFDCSVPAVLSAHAHIKGANLSAGLFRLSEQEDLMVNQPDLAEHYAYVALGHIHNPQFLSGHRHVRYSGSIERLDLGERNDAKGVVLVDLDAHGLVAEPTIVPLPSTPIYEVQVQNAAEDVPRLRQDYPNADEDLVKLQIRYTAGQDDLERILEDLEEIFPRWYTRDWYETGAIGASLVVGDADRTRSFEETVRDYVSQELIQHAEEERQLILERVETLLKEMEES